MPADCQGKNATETVSDEHPTEPYNLQVWRRRQAAGNATKDDDDEEDMAAMDSLPSAPS